MKKILILFLAVILLSGCSAKEKDAAASEQSTSADQESKSMVASKEEAAEDFGRMGNMHLIGEQLYYTMISQSENDQDADKWIWELYCQRGDQEAELLTAFTDGRFLLFSVPDTEGCMYNFYQEAEGGTYCLQKLNAQMEEIYCVPSQKYGEVLEQERVRNGEVTISGELCVLTLAGTLLTWDAQGKEMGRMKSEWSDKMIAYDNFGLANAGELGIYAYHCNQDKIVLQLIDPQVCEYKSEIEVKLSAAGDSETIAGGQGQGFIKVYSGFNQGIYLANTEKLWKYDLLSKEKVEMLSWEDQYINIKPDFVEQIAEDQTGKILILTYDLFQNKSSRVYVEAKAADEIPDKLALEIGTYYDANELKDIVQKYNDSQNLSYVSIKKYDSPSDLKMGLLRGNGPDILYLMGLTIDELTSKNILEDLAPYFDDSASLSKEDLLPSAVDAMTVNDGIRFVFPSFALNVLILESGHTNGKGGITTQEFLALAPPEESAYLCSEGGYGMDLYSLMDRILYADINSYVDWESKTSHFDSEEFIELLNNLSRLRIPESSGSQMQADDMLPAEQIKNGEYRARFDIIGNIINYMDMKDAFSGFAEITGYPNQKGELKYVFNVQSPLGINSASEQKEEAWKFLEYLLLNYVDESSYLSNFSVLNDKFERQLYPQGETNFQYNFINPYTGEVYTGMPEVQEKDAEAVRNMVANASGKGVTDYGTIISIVWNEAQYVFEGDKTAEQAAEIIQSRVNLYLQE